MDRSAVLALVFLLAACGSDGEHDLTGPTVPGFRIESPAFADGARIPDRFTGHGEDVSPALSWTGVPGGTAELLLIVDDPDAPIDEPFVHWVVAGIAPGTNGIAEGGVPDGAVVGTNHFTKTRYRGPKPPAGKVHHYRFRLYALDTRLGLAAGVTKRDALARARDHVVAMAELVGTYSVD